MPMRPYIATTTVLFGAVLSIGVAVAHADPNDPAMQETSPDGQVRSAQAAQVAGSERCVASVGTLGSSDVRTPDMNVPQQTAKEAGPDWVGSDGWQAQALTRSNPWAGNFDPRNIHTGPACEPVTAGPFS